MLRLLPAIAITCLCTIICTIATMLLIQHIASDAQSSTQILNPSLRAQDLEQELSKWAPSHTASTLHRTHSTEALRTLSLLEKLYSEEENLWTYYDALEQRLEIQQEHNNKRILLEKNALQQKQELSQLNTSIHRLRPSQDQPTIHFR